jgi:hypothetical protein
MKRWRLFRQRKRLAFEESSQVLEGFESKRRFSRLHDSTLTSPESEPGVQIILYKNNRNIKKDKKKSPWSSGVGG